MNAYSEAMESAIAKVRIILCSVYLLYTICKGGRSARGTRGVQGDFLIHLTGSPYTSFSHAVCI